MWRPPPDLMEASLSALPPHHHLSSALSPPAQRMLRPWSWGGRLLLVRALVLNLVWHCTCDIP